jgi:hypothetical protein
MNTVDQVENSVIQQAVDEFVARLAECKLIPVLDGPFHLAIHLNPTRVTLDVGLQSYICGETHEDHGSRR